MVARAY